MSVPTRFRSAVRVAVERYSIRNRHKKAQQISAWLVEHDCHDVLFVGTTGDEQTLANAGIVERRIAAERPVKMSINIEHAVTSYPFMIADARSMPFADDYVDFALANAIIEHVGHEPDQLRMVQEMSRVARCWVITTPNLWFPIESHTSTLMVHWIPAWRRRRAQDFTRLLSLRQFKRLLPAGAEVHGRPWSPTFTAYYDAARAPTHYTGAPGTPHVELTPLSDAEGEAFVEDG